MIRDKNPTMSFTLPAGEEFTFMFRLIGKRVKIRTRVGLWILNKFFKHVIGIPIGLKCTGYDVSPGWMTERDLSTFIKNSGDDVEVED